MVTKIFKVMPATFNEPCFRNFVFFPGLRLIGGWKIVVCGVTYLGEVVLDSQERRVIMDDKIGLVTSSPGTLQHLNSFGQSGAQEQNRHEHFLLFNLFSDLFCVKQVAVTFTRTINVMTL